MGETVYREPLGGLLTINILLCFFLVGFITLPIALIRWANRRLIVRDQAVTLQRGAASNTIPIHRIDYINVWRRPGGDAGTLLISARGVPTSVRVAQAEQARQDIQQRILNLQQQPRQSQRGYPQQPLQPRQPYPQYTREQPLPQVTLLQEPPPLQQPSQPQDPYPAAAQPQVPQPPQQ